MHQATASFTVPKKLLVAMDFSPSSFAALEMATDLARHFQAELSLLNIVPMFPIPSGPDYYPEAGIVQEHERCRASVSRLHLSSGGKRLESNLLCRSWQRCCWQYHDGDRPRAC